MAATVTPPLPRRHGPPARPPLSPPPRSPAPTSWLKAFTASMLAAADAGGRPRGGGKEGRGKRRGGSVPLRGCGRTWPFGGGGGGAGALPSPSLARSVGAASRWQGPGTDRLSQRDGGAHAAHSTLGSHRPPGPAPPTGGRGEGGRRDARAARREHHVTRGRVTPRAPPCQCRARPRGGEMAGVKAAPPPATEVGSCLSQTVGGR